MSDRIRTMSHADIPAGMRLKNQAGWNQTEADWRLFLDADPAGSFVADVAGTVVGTVATIVYENRLAWIGMMLVDPQFRRRGIGEGLMKASLEYLEARGVPVVGLDATPMGRPLYERLGFVPESELNRWAFDRPVSHLPVKNVDSLPESSALASVFVSDRETFGVDRSALLSSIFQAAPARVVTLETGTSSPSYAFARHGTHADHLGAWVADDASTAAAVLEGVLERTGPGRMIADVPAAHPWAGRLLEARGFRVARDLTRMYRGKPDYPARSERICAILGPEFG